MSNPFILPSAIVAMQGPVVGGQAFVRHQHKRSQPGDLLTTANQYFTENAAKSRPASAAVPAAPAQAVTDTQSAPLKQCAVSQSTKLDVSQSIPWFLTFAAIVQMRQRPCRVSSWVARTPHNAPSISQHISCIGALTVIYLIARMQST